MDFTDLDWCPYRLFLPTRDFVIESSNWDKLPTDLKHLIIEFDPHYHLLMNEILQQLHKKVRRNWAVYPPLSSGFFNLVTYDELQRYMY